MGCISNAPAMFSFTKFMYALVIPQPGQGIPKSVINGHWGLNIRKNTITIEKITQTKSFSLIRETNLYIKFKLFFKGVILPKK